jgi:hypothetical protein
LAKALQIKVRPDLLGGGMAQVQPPAMTAIKFMGWGLEIGRHTRWHTYKHEANVKWFKAAFGVIPETCVLFWDALGNSMDATVRLLKNDKPTNQ